MQRLAANILLFVVWAAADAAGADIEFRPAENGRYAFDTGFVRGEVRLDGKNQGISSLVHAPTNMELAKVPGLLSYYRVFSSGVRHGDAARDWPVVARLVDGGALKIRFPAAPTHPMEITGTFRWQSADTLDLETTVTAAAPLTRFEVFLSSYITDGFDALDYPQRRYRKPTIQDQIEMIRLGNALDCVAAINSPLICREFDPRIETIESARLLLLHTEKPGWVGASSGREVKYLAELARLVVGNDDARFRSEPPLFTAAYCTTSPLKIDARSCGVLEEAMKYGFPLNFASMPILGATTPMTPAGSAVVAAAEVLGCLTAATLIDPQAYCYSTSISAEMDMRTTQVCFATPAAILTDVILHEWFRDKYGLVHNIEPGYVEAKTPGIQAATLKVFRQMAFGATASLPLSIGALDSAAVFSPTQAMIDLEINQAMHQFYMGVEVTDAALGLDVINELGFCAQRTHLDTEHTARYFRQIGWSPKLFDRKYCDHDAPVVVSDETMLEKADQAWRDLAARQTTPEREPALVAEIDRIVAAAREELLAS